jgi:hypothetical protein
MLQEEMDAIVEMLDVRVAALKAELIEFFNAQAKVAELENKKFLVEEITNFKIEPVAKTSHTSKKKASNLNRRHTGDGKMNGV